MLKKVTKKKKDVIRERKANIDPLPPVDITCFWGCFIRCTPGDINLSAHPNGGVVDNI